DGVNDWRPVGMAESATPTDQGWWGDDENIHAGNQRNWRDACFQPQPRSALSASPMNKSRWLAKYVALLDLQFEASSAYTTESGRGTPLAYSAKPGTALATLAYSARGLWFPPLAGQPPANSRLMQVSKSFIVQKVDFENFRMVLIDTSVCESTYGGRLGVKFLWTNAGTNPCIGADQFPIIKQYIEQTPAGKQLVLAGHFPLKDLTYDERKTLLTYAEAHPGWVYMSAHSHKGVSESAMGSGWEINVGSTTDWPMEVNSLWFDRARPPRVRTVRNELPEGFRYDSTRIYGKAEVCRHLPAARYLAELRSTGVGMTYESPPPIPCRPRKSEEWNDYGSSLAGYLETITMNFATADYRNLMLRIAAAASLHEHETRDLEGLGRRIIQ
ncbi:MAG: hypothetical protein SV422_16965, partial [Pseudomonadota bacterium]|nr:hypothetical protein [Pseudomonadota bacterium]